MGICMRPLSTGTQAPFGQQGRAQGAKLAMMREMVLSTQSISVSGTSNTIWACVLQSKQPQYVMHGFFNTAKGRGFLGV